MSVAEKMTAIADAIRGKTGKTEKLSLDEMATEINEISTGERDINPEWTNWRHFSYNGNRDSLVSKLKYNDTSNGTIFFEMIYKCPNITSIPEFDTSNGTDFYYAFYGCSGITSIHELETSKGTRFGYMFSGCTNLVTIPKIDFSSATSSSSLSNVFSGCSALVNLNVVGVIKATGLSLSSCTLLTHDSLMSVINALADYSGSTSTYKLTLGSTNLAKLIAEEIAIAEGKGWTLA